MCIPRSESLTRVRRCVFERRYIKLADFGFAKKIIKGKKTYTTCGTPAYMAPEIITMAGHTTAVDWWCIGILLYEMTCGYTPFQYETNELNKLRAIVDGKYTIPSNLSASCRSIISKLLTTNPARRLGNLKRGARDVKAHPWFNGFSWTALQNMEMKVCSSPAGSHGAFPTDEGAALRGLLLCVWVCEVHRKL